MLYYGINQVKEDNNHNNMKKKNSTTSLQAFPETGLNILQLGIPSIYSHQLLKY